LAKSATDNFADKSGYVTC